MPEPSTTPASPSETSARPQAQRDESSESPARLWALRAVVVLAVAIPAAGILTAPSRELVGLSAIVLMFSFLLLRMPVAFALAIPGLLGVYAISGSRAVATLMSHAPMTSAAQWSLSVLPMFVLMGLLLGASGVTSRLYRTARNWLNWLPGGLGVGTNLAGAGLASVSGSTIGTTYALARVSVPEMFRAGYGKQITIGSVVVAGLPGQLIPPSIFLVVIAGLLNNPVGPQLIAGIVPGVGVAILFSLMIIAYSMLFPRWVGRDSQQEAPVITWGERWRSLLDGWPVVALMVVVLGGMFSGVFTATEAGAFGAAGALLLLLWFQRRHGAWRKAIVALLDTVSSVGSIFLLIAGAHVLGSLIAVSGIGRALSGLVTDLGLGRVEFLLLMMVVYILLGLFMDPLAMLIMTVPIVIPVLPLLDIDPLWFGVFAVFMSELAILTPPVGLLSFVIHKILQDRTVNLGTRVELSDVFKAVLLFLPMAIVITVLWILFPQIVTWLPGLM